MLIEAMLTKKNAPRWIRALKKYGYLQEGVTQKSGIQVIYGKMNNIS